MSNANDQAFPLPYRQMPDDEFVHGAPGLTKREYFAAMAMPAVVHNEFTSGDAAIARACVRVADALIAELSK